MVISKSKQAFFKKMEEHGLALTYDDVRVETAPSQYSASETNISSRFSRNIPLKTPFVSAAMDTVTTSDMAIAMAKLGGIGIIHAGLEPEKQAEEVRRVKLYLNGRIDNPVFVMEQETVAQVLAMCEKERYSFRTLPVVSKKGKFVGLVTHNDFDFCKDDSVAVEKIMTPKSEVLYASPSTTLRQAYNTMSKAKKKTLPLLNKDGTLAALYLFSDVARIVLDNSGQYNVDSHGRLLVGAAVPSDSEALRRVKAMRPHLDVVVIDSAQGDSKYALATLKQLKKAFPKLDVVVGNISSAKSAKALAEAGADGIKVGQGPGSICTTRIETGIGCPQVTAVYRCARAVSRYDIPICADGGIKERGDISIAFAAGAHSIMMGGMLAGTNEAPGELIRLEDGRVVKLYRGMGSAGALRDSAASRKRYGVENDAKPLAEGVESYVPYKGSVKEIVKLGIQALRKSMSYAGSGNIDQHRCNADLIRITNSGMNESRPHSVSVISK